MARARPARSRTEEGDVDKDELIRYLERKLKIRARHRFEAERDPLRDFEREFALEALDLMRRQPAMEDELEIEPAERAG
jgi:hypothetical protein